MLTETSDATGGCYRYMRVWGIYQTGTNVA